jgi:hypothetical protein
MSSISRKPSHENRKLSTIDLQEESDKLVALIEEYVKDCSTISPNDKEVQIFLKVTQEFIEDVKCITSSHLVPRKRCIIIPLSIERLSDTVGRSSGTAPATTTEASNRFTDQKLLQQNQRLVTRQKAIVVAATALCDILFTIYGMKPDDATLRDPGSLSNFPRSRTSGLTSRSASRRTLHPTSASTGTTLLQSPSSALTQNPVPAGSSVTAPITNPVTVDTGDLLPIRNSEECGKSELASSLARNSLPSATIRSVEM